MLIGEYSSKLSNKNRSAIPSKFRTEMGEDLIVTRGYERCLVLVTPNQFEDLTMSVASKEFTLSEVRDTARFLVGGAVEVNLDKQGRFVIPKNLIEYAQLGEELVYIGLNRWVEIWDKVKWGERIDFLQKNSADIAQKLSSLKDGN